MERLRLDDTAYFLYTGQEDVLMDGIRVRVHPSVRVICGKAFIGRERLISVEFHDGVEVIKEEAFCRCTSLCKILIPPSVRAIKYGSRRLASASASVSASIDVALMNNRFFLHHDIFLKA